ncbi:cytochrome c-type biogenesis protein CcmE [Anaplasma platys]|uniref:Cytochrome c-type biogenesis protein CcmE n=1 Tax=Anaplasma platys TaxID=949 RepID=A0A858PY13_9RICK|nr:cytochrome c maturation protein CcmE [Anaplasma platys]QJC27493.1 cytochrome c-type biogenesis protein CcmE [Anaplasma platys]
MKRKHKRFLFAAIAFSAIGCVSTFVLLELKKNASFFCTTTELLSKAGDELRGPVRVGGMIIKGSIEHADDAVTFTITDFKTDLQVKYAGVLPPLFGEDMGAIAKGRLSGGIFEADELLAKHDERYMPKKYTVSGEIIR